MRGTWAPQFQGRPNAFLSAGNGAYLWHDADGGWALRVTHSGPRLRAVFSGFLSSATGQFVDLTPVDEGGNDILYETADKHTVYFRFVDYDLVDGLNFGTECARAFTVDIHLGPRLVPAGDIFLGASGVNPYANPFRVSRIRGQVFQARPGGGVSPPPTTTSTSTTSTTVSAG